MRETTYVHYIRVYGQYICMYEVNYHDLYTLETLQTNSKTSEYIYISLVEASKLRYKIACKSYFLIRSYYLIPNRYQNQVLKVLIMPLGRQQLYNNIKSHIYQLLHCKYLDSIPNFLGLLAISQDQ